jgi:FAD/FMN-containing dehydrogenase
MPTVPQTNPPDPDVVAKVAADLARLSANKDSTEHLVAAQADLAAHGLEAFFHGACVALAADAKEIERALEPGAPETSAPFATPTSSDRGVERQTWQDYIGSRRWQPLRLFRPTTLDDVRSILCQAAAEGCRVKAVGSGHAFSDVGVTRDFLIDTHGLNRPLDLERDLLRPDVDPDTLFATEAGIVIRDLNEALWAAGLGLCNMGGYDGQTIAGVISTSTHGSGLGFGPLSSQVESLTLVAGDGSVFRVEPSNGITDPDRWRARHPVVTLMQDDAWFNAVQVGIGCLGVVYSVVLRVRPAYYLKEERFLSTWSKVKLDLQAGDVLRDNAHYEVLVNPYPTSADYTCLVTRRNPTPAPIDPPLEPPGRNLLVELAALVPGTSELLLAVLDAYPELTPSVLDQAMAAIVGDYVDRSYRVFNVGAANDVPAYGSEIGVPLDQAIPSVERIFAIAAQRQQVGQAYLTSPFSLRFVKASNAFMSMMQGTDTCTIEFPVLEGTVGGRELLQQIETELYALGGRPHWGLLNFLTGANDLVGALYPLLPRWLEVARQIDGAGRFANPFTERCGLTRLNLARRG